MKRSAMPARNAPMNRTPFARTPPTIRTVAAVRRARDTGPDQKTRNIVLERDGFCCVCCGKSVEGQRYSLGHRLRASQGGKPVPSNLLTFLGWGGQACHGRIDNREDPADEDHGYTVRRGKNPALIAVTIFTRDGGLVRWPDDLGNWLPEPPEGAVA